MLLISVALAAVLLGTLYGRMLVGARTELQRATSAADQGRPDAARRHLRRAISYYAPANPWQRRAVELLRQRALQAETAGHRAEALALWRSLRGAILGLRGLTRPFTALLPQANRRIAQLSGQHPQAAQQLKTPAGQQRLLERLGHPDEPHPGWTGAALTGFVLFLLAAFALVFLGLDAQTRLRPKRFWPLLLLTLLSLGLLFGGLANAAI